MKLTLGADPEVFVQDSQGEFIVPPHLGTKTAPWDTDFGAIQKDGLASEFNIKPCKTKDMWVARIKDGKEYLQHQAFQNRENISIVPVAEFPLEMFRKLSDADKEMGCDPDFNAYTGKLNDTVRDKEQPWRVAGGHVHMGWLDEDVDPFGKRHFEDCIKVVKQLDGCILTQINRVEPPSRRTEMYGGPGAFRPKEYGVEWRAPSNWWITTDRLTEFMWDGVHKAVDLLLEGQTFNYRDVHVLEKLRESGMPMIEEYHNG